MTEGHGSYSMAEGGKAQMLPNMLLQGLANSGVVQLLSYGTDSGSY